MIILRLILSNRLTLFFVSIIAGIYLFGTFGNNNAWVAMADLIKKNSITGFLFYLFGIHFFLRGAYKVVKGNFRSLPTAIIFISLSVAITGSVLSIKYRHTETLKMNIHDMKSYGLRVSDISMDIPESVLVVGDRADFSIKNPEAVLDFNGNKFRIYSYPFVKTPGGYAYINNAGISPSFELTVSGRNLSVSKLDVLPPGVNIAVPLIEDYIMEIAFHPEKEVKKGRLTAKEYIPGNPRYRVVVKRGMTAVFDEVIDDNMVAEGRNFVLRSGNTEKWVELVFVRDKAVLVIYAGLLGLLLGIILYPFELYFSSRSPG
jgi:hypothetical protein